METTLSQSYSPSSTPTEKQNFKLEFFGKGSEYFSIMIVNWLLTIVTLGIYYPWARAKKLQYVYGQTALNNERFHFSGTGKEMFRGFIKVILFYVTSIAIYFLIAFVINSPLFAILFLYLTFFAIVPFAIHGSYRYRMSRTTYRGIRFGYRGNRAEFVKAFFKWAFLTLITFGIYSAWLQMNVRRYTHKHMRFGDVEFSNNCDGLTWLGLNLQGYFLTLFTLGIYSFWWQKDIFNYYFDNMRLAKGDQKIVFKSLATGGGFFNLLFVNLLITVFTLGFGKAWADMRTQKFICNNVKMKGDLNIEEIHQTEEEYTDASGDDVMDFFEIDLA